MARCGKIRHWCARIHVQFHNHASITYPPGILAINHRWSSRAIVPVSIALLFKRVLEGICHSADAGISGAVRASEWRRQDKSCTSRHGRRGRKNISINAFPRGALSDREVRRRPDLLVFLHIATVFVNNQNDLRAKLSWTCGARLIRHLRLPRPWS